MRTYNGLWTVLAATMITACGGTNIGTTGDDAGNPITITDAGTTPRDSTVSPTDTGSIQPRDSGTTPRDATVIADAGTPEPCHPSTANFNCLGADTCACSDAPLPPECLTSPEATAFCRALSHCDPVSPRTSPMTYINHCSPHPPPTLPAGATYEAFALTHELCDYIWLDGQTGTAFGVTCRNRDSPPNGVIVTSWGVSVSTWLDGAAIGVRYADGRHVQRIYQYAGLATRMPGIRFCVVDLDTIGMIATVNCYAAGTDVNNPTNPSTTTFVRTNRMQ